MSIQTYLNNVTKAKRKESLANSDQLTLGELILKIEQIIKKHKESPEKHKEEATVRFDFEYLFPTEIDSWRGSYDELALNFISDGEELTVSAFLRILKEAIGKSFTGYKGGEYIMNEYTPVWAANYGNSGNTAVINVMDRGYLVVLVTGYREF